MKMLKEILDALPYIEEIVIRSILLFGTVITLIKKNKD